MGIKSLLLVPGVVIRNKKYTSTVCIFSKLNEFSEVLN